MELSEIANLPEDVRLRLAQAIKESDDFNLPQMQFWNYGPCSKHQSVEDGAVDNCRKCGIMPRAHQKVGIAWGFLAKKVLIADSVGLGKSSILAGVIDLIFEAQELQNDQKILMIVNAPALYPWRDDLKRMMPDVKVLVHAGIKSKRMRALNEKQWDICLVTPQTFNVDVGLLSSTDFYCVCCDDVEPIISQNSLTFTNISNVCKTAKRVLILSATPLNKRLLNLHTILSLLGAQSVLGDSGKFERRYITYSYNRVYSSSLNRSVSQKKPLGHKNIPELIEKIQPFVIRRTAADVDIDMPEVIHNPVMLQMYSSQQDLYEKLKQGAIRILKEDGALVTKTRSQNAWMIGQQICSGLPCLGMADGGEVSIKLDWIEHKITGDLEGEKVVIYSRFKNNIRALQARLDNLGIKYGTIWGEDKSKESRLATQKDFWENSEINVLLGTRAISASLNFQIAQHMIAMETELSPRIMSQLLGRIFRAQSRFSHIYFHSLLCVDSQEERYLLQNQKEQALSDVILDGSSSELYTGGLSNEELLRLIIG